MPAQRKAVRVTPGQSFTLCPAGHRLNEVCDEVQ